MTTPMPLDLQTTIRQMIKLETELTPYPTFRAKIGRAHAYDTFATHMRQRAEAQLAELKVQSEIKESHLTRFHDTLVQIKNHFIDMGRLKKGKIYLLDCGYRGRWGLDRELIDMLAYERFEHLQVR